MHADIQWCLRMLQNILGLFFAPFRILSNLLARLPSMVLSAAGFYLNVYVVENIFRSPCLTKTLTLHKQELGTGQPRPPLSIL
jgi:hypothetical protein